MAWVSLGSIVTLAVDPVRVRPDVGYRIAGVYSFGRGLLDRGTLQGTDTKYRELFRLREGQLVYSRLKAFEGAVAVVPAAASGMFVSQEFPTFTINTELAEPEYIALLCRWPRLWDAFAGRSKGLGARRERVNTDQLDAITVPLPDREHQRRIVAQVSQLEGRVASSVALSERAGRQATALWRALLRDTFAEQLVGYGSVPASEVTDINPESVDPSRAFGLETFSYIDISGVENGTGRLLAPKRILGLEAPSRARRRVRDGDVIVSSVRPNLRGSALVTQSVDGAVCSTGFVVLRPRPGLDSRYLLFQILSDLFVDQLTTAMRGGHYPAVKEDDVSRASLVVPPLEEQHLTALRLEAMQERIIRLWSLQATRETLLVRVRRAVLDEVLSAREVA